jgi:hypothetical protein
MAFTRWGKVGCLDDAIYMELTIIRFKIIEFILKANVAYTFCPL